MEESAFVFYRKQVSQLVAVSLSMIARISLLLRDETKSLRLLRSVIDMCINMFVSL